MRRGVVNAYAGGRFRASYRPESARSSDGLAPSVCLGLLSQTHVPPGDSSRALAVSWAVWKVIVPPQPDTVQVFDGLLRFCKLGDIVSPSLLDHQPTSTSPDDMAGRDGSTL